MPWVFLCSALQKGVGVSLGGWGVEGLGGWGVGGGSLRPPARSRAALKRVVDALERERAGHVVPIDIKLN